MRVLAAAIIAVALWLAVAIIALPFRAAAMDRPADVCLVLLQDTSSSLDALEYGQMRDGLAGALTDPRLSGAFARSRVQVMVVSFAGRPRAVTDWFIATEANLETAASSVLTMPRDDVGGTAIGSAIAFALQQFNRVACNSRVIDVATDGENNGGPTPSQVTANLDPDTIQVNGLVVGTRDQFEMFRGAVQFGFASFSVHAATYDDFAGAMLRKLSQEISMNACADICRRPI